MSLAIGMYVEFEGKKYTLMAADSVLLTTETGFRDTCYKNYRYETGLIVAVAGDVDQENKFMDIVKPKLKEINSTQGLESYLKRRRVRDRITELDLDEFGALFCHALDKKPRILHYTPGTLVPETVQHLDKKKIEHLTEQKIELIDQPPYKAIGCVEESVETALRATFRANNLRRGKLPDLNLALKIITDRFYTASEVSGFVQPPIDVYLVGYGHIQTIEIDRTHQLWREAEERYNRRWIPYEETEKAELSWNDDKAIPAPVPVKKSRSRKKKVDKKKDLESKKADSKEHKSKPSRTGSPVEH